MGSNIEKSNIAIAYPISHFNSVGEPVPFSQALPPSKKGLPALSPLQEDLAAGSTAPALAPYK